MTLLAVLFLFSTPFHRTAQRQTKEQHVAREKKELIIIRQLRAWKRNRKVKRIPFFILISTTFCTSECHSHACILIIIIIIIGALLKLQTGNHDGIVRSAARPLRSYKFHFQAIAIVSAFFCLNFVLGANSKLKIFISEIVQWKVHGMVCCARHNNVKNTLSSLIIIVLVVISGATITLILLINSFKCSFRKVLFFYLAADAGGVCLAKFCAIPRNKK